MEREYKILATSEADEIATSVLPLKGKENKSDILKIDFRIQELPKVQESIKYYANPKFDWIITLEAKPYEVFNRNIIEKYISNDWRKEVMYPVVYCLPEDSNDWTYFFSADENSNSYKKISLAWKLYDDTEEPPNTFTEKALSKYDKLVKKIMKKINADKIDYNYSIQEASAISNRLAEFVTENNQLAIIILQAEKQFEGIDIWDVMMSLGLRWGDMDLFHWNNIEIENGDEQLFSVWTSTEPEYFIPEDIAEGSVQTEDLIFGFSIPRSVAPREIFKVMYNAAKYAQKRLGGLLLDSEGNNIDMDNEFEKINSILNNLENESIKCGFGDALYLFQ